MGPLVVLCQTVGELEAGIRRLVVGLDETCSAPSWVKGSYVDHDERLVFAEVIVV